MSSHALRRDTFIADESPEDADADAADEYPSPGEYSAANAVCLARQEGPCCPARTKQSSMTVFAGDTKDMAPSTYAGPDAQKPAGVSSGVSARPSPNTKCACQACKAAHDTCNDAVEGLLHRREYYNHEHMSRG